MRVHKDLSGTYINNWFLLQCLGGNGNSKKYLCRCKCGYDQDYYIHMCSLVASHNIK